MCYPTDAAFKKKSDARVLLLINLVVLPLGIAQVWHGVTAGFSAELEAQQCCRGGEGGWITTGGRAGECCTEGVNRGRTECTYASNDVARTGVLGIVQAFRWELAMCLVVFGLIPYHSIYGNWAGADSRWSREVDIRNCWVYIGGFLLCWVIVMFVTANVALGYAKEIYCKNPGTSQYLMLYYHAPYDFWTMVLLAWGVLALAGGAIALIIVGCILYCVWAWGYICLCANTDPKPKVKKAKKKAKPDPPVSLEEGGTTVAAVLPVEWRRGAPPPLPTAPPPPTAPQSGACCDDVDAVSLAPPLSEYSLEWQGEPIAPRLYPSLDDVEVVSNNNGMNLTRFTQV